MSNNFKNIPILINGGTAPGRPMPGNLHSRELYLSSDGHLYYGDPHGEDEQRLSHSVVSGRLFVKSKGESYPIEIGWQRQGEGVGANDTKNDAEDEQKVVFRFGTFRYVFESQTLYCDRDPSDGTREGRLPGHIKGLGSITTSTAKCGALILTSGRSFGPSLPNTAVDGQVFFKTIN